MGLRQIAVHFKQSHCAQGLVIFVAIRALRQVGADERQLFIWQVFAVDLKIYVGGQKRLQTVAVNFVFFGRVKLF